LKTVRGVKKYAKQFLKTVDMEKVPQTLEQYSALAGLMDKNKNVRTFLTSPVFSEKERLDALAVLSQKIGMSLEATKYLFFLSAEMVLGGLGQIVKVINALYLEMKKRARAVVISPVTISEEYERSLVNSLKRLTGRDIDLEVLLDPSLLGGVRIQVGSTMYDSSIRGQLGLLKDKLIKG
jgi:ATP synthase F1 delta subunit